MPLSFFGWRPWRANSTATSTSLVAPEAGSARPPGASPQTPPDGRSGGRRTGPPPRTGVRASFQRPALDPVVQQARTRDARDHAHLLERIDAQSAAAAALATTRQTAQELARLRTATDAHAAGMMNPLAGVADDNLHDALQTLRQHLDRSWAFHGPTLDAHETAAREALEAAQAATQAHSALAGSLPDAAPGTGRSRAELEAMARAADDDASRAASRWNALRGDAEVAAGAVRQSIETLAEALQAPDAEPQTTEPVVRPRFKDLLRRPIDALRLRAAVPRLEVVIGPLGLAVANSTSEHTSKERPQVFRPTTTASRRALDAVDRHADAARINAAALLSGGRKGRPRRNAGVDAGAAAPLTGLNSAVAFDRDVQRMFGTGLPTESPSTAQLTTALLRQSGRELASRPDGHPLRHEQALLTATVLRTVTADPNQALQVLHRLRLETPAALDHLSMSAMDAAHVPDAPSMKIDAPEIARMAHAARRALASTAGGFQTLLDLQGLALPPVGDPCRTAAQQSLELYKLGLHAEDALLNAGLPVGGTQSMADIRAALDSHAQGRELLDPTRLGTGNARRRPGGPHEAEHPATLAAQAFVYATDNLRRAPGQAEMHPDFKPAYVALRNGFTVSGQGSDFHLMAKRLRKFVTYIDLACKTPEGQLPTAMHKARLPLRVLRRLAGKDKSPLDSLLKYGPVDHAATLNTTVGELDTRRDAKRLREVFGAAPPVERRDLLRQVMNSVTGGRLGTYSDGRRHGIGVTAGYGYANVAGLGGLGASITPVVELSAERSRTAVFRAGIAESGTLYLGSERKVSGSAGVGVRVGADAGPLVSLSAQAMARIGASHLASRGLMIRTRKHGQDHETLPAAKAESLKAADWQRMNELVVNSIFQIADLPKAERPAHGGAMWARMVEALGDFRDISFGWNEGKAVTADVSLSLDATASAKLAPGVGASVSAGIGLKRTLFDRKQTRDLAGAARSAQTEEGSRSAVRAGASLGFGHPALSTPSGRGVALFGRHRVGVETELLIQARSGTARLATEEGRIRPDLSTRHREFGLRDDFIKAMNAQRAQWVAALGEPGLDGRPRGGERKFDDFMKHLVNLPPGSSRIYQERLVLTPEAADSINARMDRLAVLQRPRPAGMLQDPDAADQVEDLQRQIAGLVAEPAHWVPSGLSVIQPLQATATWSGGVDSSVTMQPGDAGDGVDRLLGGGRLALSSAVKTAVSGKVLLAVDATPRPGARPEVAGSSRPDEPRLASVPMFSDSAMHDAIAL